MNTEFYNNIPAPVEKVISSRPYVAYGEENTFPQDMANLLILSPIHQACVSKKIEFAQGQKITFDSNINLSQVNDKGESIQDILEKCMADKVVFGQYAINVVWSRDGKSIASLEHVDFSQLRSGKRNPYGVVNEWYYCRDWQDVRRNKIISIPAFDPSLALEEPNQLFVYSEYAPGAQYYAKPDYLSALAYVYLDYEIGNHHIANVKKNFAPGVIINLKHQTDGPEDRDAIYESMIDQYQGTKNSGEPFIVFGPEGIEVTQVNSSGNGDMYQALNEMTQQYILTAHRITSPMILGIKTAGQLGGRSEMVDATELFQNNVIVPIQNSVTKPIQKMLALGGIQTTFNIEQLEIIKPLMPESLMKENLTQNEIREEYGYEPIVEPTQPQ